MIDQAFGKVKHKLWFWLAVAFLVRVICSYFSYGPQSLDDYRHGFYPAYQWSLDQVMNLPNYRSPLLPWMLGVVFKFGHSLGIDTLLNQLRLAMVFLGSLSLLVPIAFHLWAKANSTKEHYPLFMFVASAYSLFPFIGTRGFGEAVAMSLVTLAIVIIALRKISEAKYVFFGFAILGIATLFRFHVGVLFLVLSAAILWSDRKKFSKRLLQIACAGFLTLFLQIAIDYFAGRGFLQTLLVYLQENEGGGVNYGVSPWYALIPAFLFSSYFPITWPVFANVVKQLKNTSLKRHWILAFPALLFVVIHCFVPHKEERFLYPIIGIWVLLLSISWVEIFSKRSVYNHKIMKPFVLTLNFVVLFVLCTSTSLQGEIQPGISLSSKDSRQLYLYKDSLFEKSFFKRFIMINGSDFRGVSDFDAIKQASLEQSFTEIVMITSNELISKELTKVEDKTFNGFKCGLIVEHSNWTDRLIYKLNPGSNQRRRPSWSVTCAQT